MPTLSLRQAAAAFTVSRTTLTKDLEKGKVSGAKDEAGQWQIDAAELARVYKPRPAQKGPRPDQLGQTDPAQNAAPEPRPDHGLELKLARAEAELAAEREKTALLERHLDDLRRLLPPPDAKPRPRRRWPWQRPET